MKSVMKKQEELRKKEEARLKALEEKEQKKQTKKPESKTKKEGKSERPIVFDTAPKKEHVPNFKNLMN